MSREPDYQCPECHGHILLKFAGKTVAGYTKTGILLYNVKYTDKQLSNAAATCNCGKCVNYFKVD